MGRILRAVIRRASTARYCEQPTIDCPREQLGMQYFVLSSRLFSDASEITCSDQRQSPQLGTVRVRRQDKTTAVQELWRRFLADPAQWWDNRFNKRNPKLPDFVHRETKEALWIDSWLDPPWVEEELSAFDQSHIDGIRRPSRARIKVNNNALLSSFGKLRKLCEEGKLSDALQAVNQMDRGGLRISTTIFYRLLQECRNKGSLVAGRALQSLIERCGFQSDAFLGSHLIHMFTSFGSLWDAHQVFSKLPKPDVYAWSAIISAYAKLGQGEEGIKLFHQMQESSLKPDGHVFVAALKACTSAIALTDGNVIHGQIVASGSENNVVIANALIDMYMKFGTLPDAHCVFDKLPVRDVVTWSAMIAGYAQNGHNQVALKIFHQMQQEGMEPNNVTWNAIIAGYVQHGDFPEAFQLFQQMKAEGMEPDNVTFVSILKACTILNQGIEIHCDIVENGFQCDMIVANTLIDMYAKCGSLEDACRVFDSLGNRNVVTWNAMIAGYARNGNVQGAIQLFQQMQQEGMDPDIVAWNTLIAGYTENGHGQEAFRLYQQMQQLGLEPDNVTFLAILKACSGTSMLDNIKLIHSQVFEHVSYLDVTVANTLIHIYAKCGSLEDAHKVFDVLPDQNIVTWNALIAGYIQYGLGQEAFQIFQKMQEDGVEADQMTFVSILKSCSSIVGLDQGMLLHDNIIKSGLEEDAFVWSSLIDMYAKCGSLDNAQRLFDRLSNRDVVIWNVMIAGYAQNNEYNLALRYFRDMQQKGMKPDDVTYVSLLSACSHVGLVDEGCSHFKLMRDVCHIAPTVDHYNCMVDILGRAGCLKEAEGLLKSVPFQHNIVGWTSLLGHCRIHGNVELGRRCFDHLVSIDRTYAAGYMLMSNIYSHSHMRGNAETIEDLRKCADAWKKPGSALMHVDEMVHEFTVRDRSHSQSDDIYTKLSNINIRIKEQGHMPWLGLMLPSSDELKNVDIL